MVLLLVKVLHTLAQLISYLFILLRNAQAVPVHKITGRLFVCVPNQCAEAAFPGLKREAEVPSLFAQSFYSCDVTRAHVSNDARVTVGILLPQFG